MEVGQDRRIQVVGGRLSKVVEAGPDELSGALRNLVFEGPFIVGFRCPGRCIEIVGTDLARPIVEPSLVFLIDDRKDVIPSRRDAGGRFRTVEGLSRVGVPERLISMGLIVESIDINRLRIGLRSGP